jgi:acylphosphatase
MIMDAQTAIRQAEKEARWTAARNRIVGWIERAKDGEVEIVSETPKMERENLYVTADMLPTGEVEIRIRLTGVKLERSECRAVDSLKRHGEYRIV